VVREGVLDKGMPAWGALMSDAELNSVVAYVKTLNGTKPSNPKAPQGTEVK
jgi:cytochrome c oxidase cbb3-type subunit 3